MPYSRKQFLSSLYPSSRREPLKQRPAEFRYPLPFLPQTLATGEPRGDSQRYNLLRFCNQPRHVFRIPTERNPAMLTLIFNLPLYPSEHQLEILANQAEQFGIPCLISETSEGYQAIFAPADLAGMRKILSKLNTRAAGIPPEIFSV